MRDAVVRRKVNSLNVLHVGQIKLVKAALVGVGDVSVPEVMAKILR